MTKKVVIAGGGITGLSAAYYLKRRAEVERLPVSIKLFERKPKAGGLIETIEDSGFLLERGPDSFITDKPWASELVRELGLEEKMQGTHSEYRGSFVLSHGRLKKIPEGFYLLAPVKPAAFMFSDLLTWRGKLRALAEVFVAPRRESGDESAGAFIRRRFGKELYERIGQAMIGGIYSADPDQLSVEAALPRFREMEIKHGSIIRALRRRGRESSEKQASGPRYGLFASMKEGMQGIVDELAETLGSEILKCECGIKKIRWDGLWKMTLDDGVKLEADAVILALPSWASAILLEEAQPLLAKELSRIRYESAATINLCFKKQSLAEKDKAFGYVVPAVENRPILGCTISSLKFRHRAPEGGLLLRAFAGGPRHRALLEKPDAELLQIVENDVLKTFGIESRADHRVLSRHANAMPQYEPGHGALVRKIFLRTKEVPGLFLAGNAYEGIGIPDCIKSGRDRALETLSYLFPARLNKEASPECSSLEEGSVSHAAL